LPARRQRGHSTSNGAAPLDCNFGQRLDQVVDRAIEEGRIVGALSWSPGVVRDAIYGQQV
jgi:hypothetical protein